MDIRILNSAFDVPDDLWSHLSCNPYESRGWFLANQECFRDIQFKYLCAYNGNELEAILPVYDTLPAVYPIELGAYYGRYASASRQMRYLISGSPYSNNSDIIGNRLLKDEMLKVLIELCREMSKDAALFPYTDSSYDGDNMRISKVEYVLSLRGNSMEDYLTSLSKKRRWSVKYEMESSDGMIYEHKSLSGFEDEMKMLYDLTCDKYSNHDLKAFPKEFYFSISKYMKDRAQISVALKNGETKGMFLYLISNGYAGAFHSGIPAKDFTYFNLAYYDLISFAYRINVKVINYRSGSAEAKMARGCIAVPRYISVLPVSFKAKVFTKAVKSGQKALCHARSIIKSGGRK